MVIMVVALIGIIAAASMAIGFTIVPTNKSTYSLADAPRWGNDNGQWSARAKTP